MKISTFNINKFQGPYSNPCAKGGYYNPRNIDFKTPIKNLCSRYLENEDDIIFVQEFYDDDNKVRTKEYFEKNGYKVFHNLDKILKSHVVAITKKKSLWEVTNLEGETEFQNKFIEMELKGKLLKIISFHNTDEKIKDKINNEFDRGDKDIILGDFNNTDWINTLHDFSRGYRDLVTNDMITYKPAQTSIDRIFINENKYENKIIFNGIIETYMSDHNFLTFSLNI